MAEASFKWHTSFYQSHWQDCYSETRGVKFGSEWPFKRSRWRLPQNNVAGDASAETSTYYHHPAVTRTRKCRCDWQRAAFNVVCLKPSGYGCSAAQRCRYLARALAFVWLIVLLITRRICRQESSFLSPPNVNGHRCVVLLFESQSASEQKHLGAPPKKMPVFLFVCFCHAISSARYEISKNLKNVTSKHP